MSILGEQSNLFAEELQNYMSDSDVEDPKYSLKNSTPFNTESSEQKIMNNDFQGKIMNLQKNVDIKNKNIMELENEINLYKIQLVSMREKLASKDNLISQYQSTIQVSKEKINQLTQLAEKLKNENESLMNKNSDLETELKAFKSEESKIKPKDDSSELIHQHIEEIQNSFTQKENKLNKKFKEKEDNIRKDYLNEITKLNKEIETLRTENAKLKFENSDHNVTIEKLNTEFNEKSFEYSANLNKKDKEISKLNEKLKGHLKKCEELENQFDKKNTFNEENLRNLTEEKDTLLSELQDKDKKIYDYEDEIEKLKDQINILNEEISQKNESLTNKDLFNNKLKNQISLLENNITETNNEIEIKKQNNQKELSEQTIAIRNLVQEKNQLLEERNELENSLNIATNKIVELNDIIQDKISFFNSDRYKEKEKNENLQKKLKGIIRELKFKEKSLTDENQRLKSILSDKENEKKQMELTYQNELNNLSLYNNFNNSQMIGNNQNLNNTSIQLRSNSAIGNINNYQNQYIATGNSFSYNLNDSGDDGQKKTLDEFKRLLAKIDEKLDENSKNF
ncbi:MAG: hypothetical protein MJ252_08380 [archaeon]|nr:hypothetical protein [archaeon]